MKDIVIIGYGGLAREIAEYIRDINNVFMQWNLLGFSTYDKTILGRVRGGVKICFLDSDVINHAEPVNSIIGIGFPQDIFRVADFFSSANNVIFPNLEHPRSYRSSSVLMGVGNVCSPGVVLSVDLKIGSYNYFNWNVTVGHDTEIGDYNVFNPSCNISGSTRIGSRILVGTGAQVLQGLSICSDVIIGAGAVVTKDITGPGTYVGIPARKVSP